MRYRLCTVAIITILCHRVAWVNHCKLRLCLFLVIWQLCVQFHQEYSNALLKPKVAISILLFIKYSTLISYRRCQLVADSSPAPNKLSAAKYFDNLFLSGVEKCGKSLHNLVACNVRRLHSDLGLGRRVWHSNSHSGCLTSRCQDPLRTLRRTP